jgi:hypothetical protein
MINDTYIKMSSTNSIKYTKVTCLTDDKTKPHEEGSKLIQTKDDRDRAVLAKFNMLQDKYGLRHMIYTN